MKNEMCRYRTSNGDVGDAMLGSDVDSIRYDAVEGLSDHREVC